MSPLRDLYHFYFQLFILFSHTPIFRACCFRQVAQGYFKGVPNVTWTHSYRFVSQFFYSTNKPTRVSSNLIECPIHMALCHICSLTKETYSHLRTKWIILNKNYKSLSGPIHLWIFAFFGLITTTKISHTRIYMCVCECVCVWVSKWN